MSIMGDQPVFRSIPPILSGLRTASSPCPHRLRHLGLVRTSLSGSRVVASRCIIAVYRRRGGTIAKASEPEEPSTNGGHSDH